MNSIQKVAFVVHEQAARKLIKSNEIDTNFLELVRKAPWGSRPNSTTRLTLANLKAIQSLNDEFEIKFFAEDQFSEDLASELGQYDVIVVNSIASIPSIRFTVDLLTHRRSQNEYPKIIVGTEATWAAQIANGNITEEEYDLIYFGDCLLRHTARTDREIYTRPDVHEAAIQEFELGIDQDLFEETTELDKRKTITFVKAPEGRKTKNNESIAQILAMLQSDDRFNEFSINVVEPPYAITDYWEILGKSSYLIFTSLGETFSYALNDAKALGVVTFLPRQMYYSTIGRRFAVDGYPEIGYKYDQFEEITSKILEIEKEPGRWERESQKSKEVSIDRFGLDAVTRNWRSLFSGENLNSNSLYLVSAEDELQFDEIVKAAKQHSCEFAMSIHNHGVDQMMGRLSAKDFQNNVTMLAYYLSMGKEGLLRHIDIVDGFVLANNSIPVSREDMAQTESFLQLICRTNKIGRIVATNGAAEYAGESLSKLTTFGGIVKGMQTLEIEKSRN